MAETVAFITGGNRGIGFETAKQLAQKGITVVIGSRDESKGREAAETLRKGGYKAEVLRFDATNPADIQGAYDHFDKNYGKLDILVNNAGIAASEGSSLDDPAKHLASLVPQETLRKIFETNFFAVIALTQALLPLIKKSHAGRIVNLSSILGSLTLHSDPSSPIYGFKSLAYNASKTALNAFTVHLAHELQGTNVKVNSAHPGWVKTEMGGEGAMLEIPEGAKTSVDLATIGEDGPNGGYIHMGETLPW